MDGQNRFTANTALFLTALIWGLSFVAQRAGMEYIGPFTFNAIRSVLGGISLVPVIIWVKTSHHDNRTVKVKHYQHITLLRAGIACGLALFIAITLQQYCIQYVTAGKSGFITALYIIFVPVLAVLGGQNIRKNIVISVVLALIGLYLLCWKAESGLNVFDFITLVSAFFYAIHIMVVSYYSKHVNPIKLSCVQFFAVGILSGLLVLFFENPNLCAIKECAIPLLYSGIITCGVAYTLQIYGQKHTLPVVASLIFSLEAVFAVIGGAIILGETMTVREIMGCCFMITAVILSNIRIEKRF